MAAGGKRVKTALPDGVHVWSDGFTFRLDLDTAALARAAREAGVRRFVFNWTLARIVENTEQWQTERDAGVPASQRVKPLRARALYDVFKTDLPVWWADADVSVWTYRKAIDDAVSAHERWMKGLAAFPRFAQKGVTVERFSAAGHDVVLTEAGKVRLPKFGWVRIAGSPSRLAQLRRQLRRDRARLMRVTMSRHADGTWWLSGTVEHKARTAPVQRPSQTDVVGADRGLKTACVAATSAGVEVVSLPAGRRYRDTQKRLARAQRQMARRHQRGVSTADQSAGYRKARARAGRLHEQVRLQRNNDLHCYTRQLVGPAPVVVLEDLHVKGMVRNRHLSKAFADQGLGELARQVTYKMARSGGQTIVADRWFPSSKRCSGCGRVKPKLGLSERTYTCSDCGLVIDRDLNAAINLAMWGETALAHPGLAPNDITSLVLVSSPTSGTVTQTAGQDLVSMPVGGDVSAAGQPAVVAPDEPGTPQLAHAG